LIELKTLILLFNFVAYMFIVIQKLTWVCDEKIAYWKPLDYY